MDNKIEWQHVFSVPKNKLTIFVNAVNEVRTYKCTGVVVMGIYKNHNSYDVWVNCYDGNPYVAKLTLLDICLDQTT